MPVIIDYGVGNLFSLTSSFKFIGEDVTVTSDKKKIAEADKLILPGVGAFEDAAKALRETGMYDVVKEEAKKGYIEIFPDTENSDGFFVCRLKKEE